jgi:hypothetical protein
MVLHGVTAVKSLDSHPVEPITYIAGWSSLVARLAHNQEVVGSNPTLRNQTNAGIAQLVEQLPCKHQVPSSNLGAGTIKRIWRNWQTH